LFLNIGYIKRYYIVGLICILCGFCIPARAQYFTLKSGRNKFIPFHLVRNLIVIQLKINNKGPYNFVLDTGVGYMLITEPSLVDSITNISKRSITINGFGNGDPFEAFITSTLKVDIPGLISNNVSAAIFKKDAFGLSNYAGIPIHGLIGYEFFSRLAVKISFTDSTLRVALPKNMRFYKKADKVPLSIEEGKPYLSGKVIFADGSEKQSKLIVDLGAGHFISMENVKNKSSVQKKAVNANLGMGINGLINGTLSRISEVDIGKYKVKDVIAAFPDDDTQTLSIPRDGNIGIGLIKKFDVIFDYPDSVIYLKTASNFKRKDEHDMSGLVYYLDTQGDLRRIMIYKIEEGSAGEEAGFQPNDEIVDIDFKPIERLSLQQIDDLFKSANGRTFVVGIARDNKYIKVLLTLKRRI
jgi:hypothetical protein